MNTGIQDAIHLAGLLARVRDVPGLTSFLARLAQLDVPAANWLARG